MNSRLDPRTLGARCKRCPFSRHGLPVQPVLGEGPKSARGVLVGEGPGRDEADAGRPFVGMTGQELDRAMLQVKLDRSKVFVVNATCCRPPPGKTEAMMRKAVDRCRPVLISQLEGMKKIVGVFAMGKWAQYALTGDYKGLKNWRGFLQKWNLDMTKEAHVAWRSRLKKKVPSVSKP